MSLICSTHTQTSWSSLITEVCVVGTAGIPQRKSSTSATWRAAGRSTERHPTYGPTCAGTPVRGRLSVTGSSVARGSPGATSCRDTGEHTQVGESIDTDMQGDFELNMNSLLNAN